MRWAKLYLWLAIKAVATAVDNYSSNVPLVLKEDNLSALSTCHEVVEDVATGQSLARQQPVIYGPPHSCLQKMSVDFFTKRQQQQQRNSITNSTCQSKDPQGQLCHKVVVPQEECDPFWPAAAVAAAFELSCFHRPCGIWRIAGFLNDYDGLLTTDATGRVY